jgi:3-phosphoshikimate 1-carboxyvinyltransferase
MRADIAPEARVFPVRRLLGRLRVPGDKSISHRYAMLAALARGTSTISGFAPGADCATTLACLAALGVPVSADRDGRIEVIGAGPGGLRPPGRTLDAENSGTTLRLLAGILAARPFETTLTGDASLRRRPMRRVIEPLERMGARIASADGRAPLTVTGGDLVAIDYSPEVPSAQVKSAILLAGLHARGRTVVREPAATRDHTERALAAFGAQVSVDGLAVAVAGGQTLAPRVLVVPGDISSAAFWIAGAAALPGSDVEIEDVGLNPTRTALLDVARRFGARVDVEIAGEEAGEPRGRVRVRGDGACDLTIAPGEVPALIDELPALAAMAAHRGSLTVTGAAELRGKESDRITSLVAGLRALGADADELPDGFTVRGTTRLRGGAADAAGDHRLAMALAVAALGAREASLIGGAGSVAISYPGFFADLGSVTDDGG